MEPFLAPLTRQLDELYIAFATKLGSCIPYHIPATSETLDTYLELLAPRLSICKSPKVPRAFQDLWRSGFADANTEWSEECRLFLGELLVALPGFITVRNLDKGDTPISSERREHTVVPPSRPTSRVLIDASNASDIIVAGSQMCGDPSDMSKAYDADVSQSQGPPMASARRKRMTLSEARPVRRSARRNGSAPQASPSLIEESTENSEVPESSNALELPIAAVSHRSQVDGDDVFGSTAMVGSHRKGTKKQLDSWNPISQSA